jgi:hypothetical protein
MMEPWDVNCATSSERALIAIHPKRGRWRWQKLISRVERGVDGEKRIKRVFIGARGVCRVMWTEQFRAPQFGQLCFGFTFINLVITILQ